MGREVVLRVDKVVAEGDGLGRDESGKVVFVEGALPGELVSARVISESKDYARAVAVQIREAHARRITPPCPHVADGCGGCDLQHADVDLQMEIKRSIVEESLRRLGGIDRPDVRIRRIESPVPSVPFTEPVPFTEFEKTDGRDGEPSSVRTTVRVVASGTGVGFRRRRSHDVVPIETCLVAHPRVNQVIADLELSPGAEAVVRVSSTTNDALVWVESEDSLVASPSDVRIGVDATIRQEVRGVEFRVSAGSFFQSSPAAARALVDSVEAALGPADSWPEGPVVDAYGGVGLFAATVVPTSRRVVSIEMNPFSCADARVNLSGRDVTFVESRVEDWVPEPAAVVIADPARDGLRFDAVTVLTSARPKIFVLVSCDPASLGRDAKLLGARGYRLEYSEVLDVFTHTHHVEAVSRFVRTDSVEEP